MKYKGIIIKESLEDPSILGSFETLKQKTSDDGAWEMYTVLIEEADIEKLSRVIKEGTWYCHFWEGKNIIAVFRNKTFSFDAQDKASWIPVLKYGRFLGIPEEQLDFPTEYGSVYVFIDASNIWAAIKAKTKFLNYEKLVKHLRTKFLPSDLKIFYYDAYPAEGTRVYTLDPKHKFYVYLKKALGFEVHKKPLKRILVTDGHRGQSFQEKGNMDVEMTIDAMHHLSKYDTAVFFSGDSDFLALVSYVRNAGKKVFVYSSKNNISQELRTGADGYTDLLLIEDDIWGTDVKHRANRNKLAGK